MIIFNVKLRAKTEQIEEKFDVITPLKVPLV